MAAPRKLLSLVEKFERNFDAYKTGHYNEAQVRKEFIDPLFKLLGWDMDNEDGLAEAYKDVIHEDAIKIGGFVKAPDYCFRIGGTRKFFLEAKKPAISIKDDTDPAFQLRRYAWSAKLPLSILTDFEEFAVYDCRVKPVKTDKASTARTLYFNYKEYADRWDEIASVFSKDAVLKGSFDKYAESHKAKRGTASVDEAFLKEVELWRDMLARNIALRNSKLTQRELNVSVQSTIDRIIFLRICEDRRIEEYGRLMALQNGTQVYQRLCKLFRDADARYNSGIFHFNKEKDRPTPPDELTPGLKIDDKVLQKIFKSLYYPESPYEFSVLSADILGQVYEQFLGKVISLTSGHRASIDYKPEVKKAGGVYYTPIYIVDYIVKNTVGKLLDAKKPGPRGGVSKLRILDPACGSGSFLIGAYQYLLDWHRDKYVGEDRPKKHRKVLYQAAGGEWQLTTAERKRILLNNIYGVDIDPQAVEVTKLSLLLKVLEGESGETLTRQLKMFHERALPDLGNNIKCGNSLIGPDFYDNRQMNLLDIDADEQYRINAFDWHAEFPEIMKSGGFDAVIGNPPYIRVRVFRDLSPYQAAYFESKYTCAIHVWDVYLLFFERAIRLATEKGRISFIVPIQTLHQPNCESLRRLLLSATSITTIADLSNIKVFQNAIVKNCVIVCEKDKQEDSVIETLCPAKPEELTHPSSSKWPQATARSNPLHSLKLALLSPAKDLCDKLRAKSWRLDDLCYVTFGLRSCAKGKGQGGKDRLVTTEPRAKNVKPYMEGREICRYAMSPSKRFIRYIPKEMYSPRQPELFEAKKIVSRSMLSKMQLVATLDSKGYYVEQSLVCIIPHGILTRAKQDASLSLEFILGMVNSRLENFYFATQIIDFSLGGGLVHATPGAQSQLIIPKVEIGEMEKTASLVERMLDLNKKLQKAKTEHDKTVLKRQIDSTDRQIDNLVYELYGLTKKEIAIVEESAK
ncbi:MAG: N-6 DNA methylase [Candidatus Brocadiales bacterium]|nr:N-6 DNA methylase [Candidatus Bathyanammoxibius amoris]